MSGWPAGRRLTSIYDALYRALGEGAPRARHDAFAVRLHEASRRFGALALALRSDEEGDVDVDVDVDVDPLIYATLVNSLAEDDSGALTLYALAMVIGPRLAVTLRDYLDLEEDPAHRATLSHGSDEVIAEIRAVGAVVAHEEPRDDPAWSGAARAIYDAFDAAGMSESLGQNV